MKNIKFSPGREENNLSSMQAIKEECGVETAKCYQCGKCSAGCPVAFAMDLTPRQIIRLLQWGLAEDALKSKTIWLCAGCQTCTVRCPQEVDIAKVMESLRISAKRQGYIGDKKIDLFHRLFLKSVERNGRVHEMGLIVGANLLGFEPLKDVEFGLPMLSKGKITPLPHRIKNIEEVKKIFANVRKKGGKV
ncbi:MAG TPA: heterodisulfide reductase subunit C [Peptococcaceae bacterium]|nr:heterodisulfide reductase subunit C [Peptococcaceae bacterium]